jgi:hypothetical protein
MLSLETFYKLVSVGFADRAAAFELAELQPRKRMRHGTRKSTTTLLCD